MEQGQQKWQGTERRQSQGSYIGEERRKAKPVFEEPANPDRPSADNPGLAAQPPKNARQAKDPNQH